MQFLVYKDHLPRAACIQVALFHMSCRGRARKRQMQLFADCLEALVCFCGCFAIFAASGCCDMGILSQCRPLTEREVCCDSAKQYATEIASSIAPSFVSLCYLQRIVHYPSGIGSAPLAVGLLASAVDRVILVACCGDPRPQSTTRSDLCP